MAITSFKYIFAVLIILILYFSLQKTPVQRYITLVAGLFFMYSYSGLAGLTISLLVILIVFLAAKRTEKYAAAGKTSRAKVCMWIGITADLMTLLYFKFFLFSLDYISAMLRLETNLIAPVGISYFSLSLIHYLIDVSHKKYPAETNYLALVNFALFFPAIIEGPFGFYKKLSPQLKTNHTFDWDRMVNGLQRLLWGYFKKLVIADRIGIEVMGILGDSSSLGAPVFYAMVLYSFQLYADFSGGIDVIMGISEIMGISLHENFRSPLVSKSVTDYWSRWHMSLGEWMEKVIYYPLVLSRRLMKFSKKINSKHLSRAFSATVASVIVFIIVGIWHGTGWNYVVYGCYQALFVASAVLLKPFYQNMQNRLKIKNDNPAWRIFQILRTFIILIFGRLIIKAKDLTGAKELIMRMFSSWNPHALIDGSLTNYGLDLRERIIMYIGILMLIASDVLHERGVKFRNSLMKCHIAVRYFVYLTFIMMIVILGIYGEGYDASTFIYAGF